ncbi:MAG: GNAT family N-acetyltransferase [Shimia sp.]|uniref:GNAT family N-acetyltransferase n=1 Tax=Shimia sp. TaxID=1954381 RepID=UPI003B8B3D30
MIIRHAIVSDAERLSNVLKELKASGKRRSPDTVALVLSYYLQNSNKVLCIVAEENGELLGFQSLQRAVFDNNWGVKPGWGIIGTHIRPSAARRGIGRTFFNETRKAAVIASLPMLDATIAADNPEALAYYDAMGFSTYRTPGDLISKCYKVR